MKRTATSISVTAASLICMSDFGWTARAADFPRGLASVSAYASDDVWASGVEVLQFLHHPRQQIGLTEHWDGHTWTWVGTGDSAAGVPGVAAVGPRSSVAVGSLGAPLNPFFYYHDLANGDISYQLLRLPPGVSSGEMLAVSGRKIAEVWAVGIASSPQQALVYRVSGSNQGFPTWSSVLPPPAPPGITSIELSAVAVLSPNDVWMGGSQVSTGSASESPLFEHWDGSSISIIPNPVAAPASQVATVGGFAAFGKNDVWAVIHWAKSHDIVTEHWNGKTWTARRMTFPTPAKASAIGGSASNDLWLVGELFPGSSMPLALHWDGSAWSQVPTAPAGDRAGFYGIAAVASNDVWAVGYTVITGQFRTTLAEHWDGTVWTAVPTP